MVKLQVYISDGNVYSYEVPSEAKAREHASAIIRNGYRSVTADEPDVLTWFPPHTIVKVKAVLGTPSSTKYFDTVSST